MGAGSTTSKIFSKGLSEYININIDTLSNICKKYVPENMEIEFCKIDIEGGEKNALLGYNFKDYRPKVFCIESTEPGTNIPCHKSWEDILLNNDYSFAYQYSINRYYIDKRIQGLKEKFYDIDNYIQFYKKIKLIKKEFLITLK